MDMLKISKIRIIKFISLHIDNDKLLEKYKKYKRLD